MAQVVHAQSAPAHPSRRQFFAGTVKSGAGLSALRLAATGAAGMGMSGFTQTASASAAPDLLVTLGARIAIEVQSELGSANAGYSIHFLDAAGPSCAGLREGLKQAFSAHGFKFEEDQVERNHSLGEVTIRNLETGRSLKVELFPEALSQAELIEQSFAGITQRKLAMMASARDGLFALS
jgi:hypothetical protein